MVAARLLLLALAVAVVVRVATAREAGPRRVLTYRHW